MIFVLPFQVKESCAFMGHCSMRQRFDSLVGFWVSLYFSLTLKRNVRHQLNKNVLIFFFSFFLVFQCVKINVKDKQIKYFIHYSGWNKKWAAWFFILAFSSHICCRFSLVVVFHCICFIFLQLGWMGSWKQSSQICGQQPCKTKRASKGQSVSLLGLFTDMSLWVLWQ